MYSLIIAVTLIGVSGATTDVNTTERFPSYEACMVEADNTKAFLEHAIDVGEIDDVKGSVLCVKR